MASVQGWVAAALAAAVLFATRGEAAPLDAYGRLPAIEDAAVSPSGHAVALVVTDGEKRTLVVRDLATGQAKLYSAGEVKVRSLQWAGDRHLVIVTSVTAAPMEILHSRREWFMAFTLDLTSGKLRPLLRDVEMGMNTIFGAPVVRTYKGEPTVFVQGLRLSGGCLLLSLFRIDLDRSTSKLIEQGTPETVDWIVGTDGRPVAEERYSREDGRWSLRVRNGGGWREVQNVKAPLDPPHVLGLGRDGRSVLYTMDGRWREARLDAAGASEPMIVAQEQAPLADPQDGRLIGHYALIGDEARYTFFDSADAKLWNSIVKAYGGEPVRLVSASTDRRKIIVEVDSPAEGPAFAMVDMNSRQASWLGASYPGLKAADVSPKQAIRFNAGDGLELTGYLTLPQGRSAKDLPLVVFPHGGPASRDEPGFDWWAQGMASRGYAVLQVNFRGSDGLTWELLEAGYGQWGRKMQTDLSDGVRYLALQGVIDAKRVCIVGASYGGYAALAGATIDRGVYRCAVSVAGLADLRKHIAYARTRSGAPATRYWTRFMGAEDLGDPVLKQFSPAHLADKADIPILLIHGRDDTVVPLEQSRIMAESLQKAGKPYELVVLKGEDHWLTRGETRLETLKATVAFLEKHNPPY